VVGEACRREDEDEREEGDVTPLEAQRTHLPVTGDDDVELVL
jgi:hypothetical protein